MYNIKYNESIFIFAQENHIVTSDILEHIKDNIEKFPYMYPLYNRHGVSNKNCRVVKIPNRNLEILYIIFEDNKIVVIEDIAYLNSSVKLK